MPIEIQLHKPQSLTSKAAGKILGAPVRLASYTAGIPRTAMQGINYLSDLANSKGQSYLSDMLPNFKIPQEIIEQAPTGESLNNALKQIPGANNLPRNFFEHEPWIDNPAAAVLSAPLMGMGMASSIIPSLGGEAIRNAGEQGIFGNAGKSSIGQGVLDLLGFYLGHKGQNIAGKVFSKTPQIAQNMGQKFAEKYTPGLKPYNKMVSEEEKATLKAAREAESVAAKTAQQKASEHKYLEKFREENLGPRQQELSSLKTTQEEAKLKLKEAEDLQDELRKFNMENIKEKTAEDLTTQKIREQMLSEQQKQQIKLQNQIEKLNVEADAAASKGDAQGYKSKLKEVEALESQRTKFNEENIGEESALDAQVKARREKIANQIDNFQAQNNDIMSKEDAELLKHKIESGQKIGFQESLNKQTSTLRDQLQGITGDIENLQTHEALIAEKFGASPKEMRTRINNLYSEFEESIPNSGLKTSANKIEAVNKIMEKRIGEKNIKGAESYDFIRELIDDTRARIKDGQIDVKDLSKLAPEINNKVAHLRSKRKANDLIGIEKLYGEYTNAVKETIKGVKNQHPGVKTEKWFEANNLTRQLAENADASKWVNASFQHLGLKSLSHVLKSGATLRNPAVRKYVLRAVTDHAAGDLGQATKNLVVANKMAEKSLAKETKLEARHTQARLPKGIGREIIVKNNSLSL